MGGYRVKNDLMQRLANSRALVTGGSRGIGAAVARRLAAEGAAVTITYYRHAEQARALVAELTGAGHTAFAFQGDVRDRAAAHTLARQAADSMGGLDVLISNAGVEYFGPLAGITEEDFRRVFDTNVAGQLYAVQAAVPLMTGGGRIVLMSSVSAGIAVFEHSLYAASKAAVVALARNLAPELAARNIAINAIAPGGTATDMAAENSRHYTHPLLRGHDLPPGTQIGLHASLGRLADPEEIAAAIAFLVSPDAAYLNGSTLAADGGWM
jgi:3-oxoacyl-[acyl-carrier protein] reductase